MFGYLFLIFITASGFVSSMQKSTLFAPAAAQAQDGERLSATQAIERGFSEIRDGLKKMRDLMSDRVQFQIAQRDTSSLIATQQMRINQAVNEKKISAYNAGPLHTECGNYLLEHAYILREFYGTPATEEELRELRERQVKTAADKTKDQMEQAQRRSQAKHKIRPKLRPKMSRPDKKPQHSLHRAGVTPEKKQSQASTFFSYAITTGIVWYILKQFRSQTPLKARADKSERETVEHQEA